MLLRGIFCAAHYHWEKWIGNVGHDHSNCMSSLFRQASCDKIGAVIELADSRFNTLAKLFSDVLLAIDDSGDGEDRYL